jgi:Tfp pilus assembly protein PilX
MRVTVRRDEAGTMAVALSVMLILSGLALAVLARSIAGIRNVRHHQDFSAALAAADAGLSDALFRIDQQGIATSSVGSNSAPITGTVSSGSYHYVATKVDEFSFVVKSKGVVNGRSHAVQATVRRQLKYPFAIFGVNGVSFSGNPTNTIYAVTPTGAKDPSGEAVVGSNNAIVVPDGKQAGDRQVYYTPDGSCSGCPNPVQTPGPYLTADPVLPGSAFPGGCPGSSGTVPDGHTIPAGTYICDKDLKFSGTVKVGGKVVIYLVAPSSGASTNIRLQDSVVNKGGDPLNLEILKVNAGQITAGEASSAADFTGIIYAPKTDMTVKGKELIYEGALLTNTFNVNGAPNLVFKYHSNLRTEVSKNWRVQDYSEVPSNSVGF